MGTRAHTDADHPVVQMEGTAVFRWAPFAMAEVAHEALRLAGVGLDDLDAFVPHQANCGSPRPLARNIGLPETIAIATDVVDSGNTSAASVPLAMEAMLRKEEAAPGDTALLIASAPACRTPARSSRCRAGLMPRATVDSGGPGPTYGPGLHRRARSAGALGDPTR